MIGHIQDAKSPRDAWDALVHNNEIHTKARKILLEELHTVKMHNMSINNYTLKIKNIVESLASIGVTTVTTDDDDKVEVSLRGLGSQYKQFKTSI